MTAIGVTYHGGTPFIVTTGRSYRWFFYSGGLVNLHTRSLTAKQPSQGGDMNNPRPHARTLRTGRISESGRCYLVTTVTHERQPFFADWHCGRLLVHTLARESFRAETLAFVVMPDHLHWLMALKEDAYLGTVMRSIKNVSGRQVNAALRRRGTLWQSGFHDHALRKDEDLVSAARYIVANPLRAGLVRSVADYPLWDAVWL